MNLLKVIWDSARKSLHYHSKKRQPKQFDFCHRWARVKSASDANPKAQEHRAQNIIISTYQTYRFGFSAFQRPFKCFGHTFQHHITKKSCFYFGMQNSIECKIYFKYEHLC